MNTKILEGESNMKKVFMSVVLGLFICFGILVVLLINDDSFDSKVDKYDDQDYESYQLIAVEVFRYFDNSDISVGFKLSSTEIESNIKLKSILSDYVDDIYAISYVDEDVVFMSIDSIFHSVDGIVITRKNPTLLDTYDMLGYDNGTLKYQKLDENVYKFSAGL